MTALTVYYTNTASGTLGTANTMYITSGTPTTNQKLTLIDNSTGYGEIYSQGNAGAWAAAGSIGAPSGHGFLWDVTTLEGQTIVAGNWSGAIRLNSQSGASFTASIFLRAYKYNAGVYTAIVSMTLAAQSFTGTIVTYSLPATSASAASFATGDKLYIDAWLNITSNSGAVGNQVKINRLSTDTVGSTGDPTAEVVTPGYSSSAVVTNYTFTEPLTASDALNGGATYAPSDNLSTGDSLLVSGSAQIADGLSTNDSLLTSGTTQIADALSASDSLLLSGGYIPVDVLSVADSAVTSNATAFTELLLPVESLLGTPQVALVEALSANSAPMTTGNALLLDLLSANSQFTSTMASQILDAVPVSSQLSATMLTQILDALIIADTFTTQNVAPSVTLPTTIVFATFRSGNIQATFRSGEQIATFRNGFAVVGGR